MKQEKSEKIAYFMQNNAESVYLCRDESEFSDSCPHQWLWQNNDCQRVDGAFFIEGHEGAALQVRPRLYRYQVSCLRMWSSQHQSRYVYGFS